MTGEQGSFAAGAFMVAIISLAISVCADSHFPYVEKQYKQSVERCAALGSTPKSVDHTTVTCENGIEVDWR